MCVLVWGTWSADQQDQLRAALHSNGYWEDVLIEPTVDSLRDTLLERRAEIQVLILAPGSRAQLSQALKLQPLLSELRVVVLAPDDSDETNTMIHGLRPRFVARKGDDASNFAHVVANLAKAVQNLHKAQATPGPREEESIESRQSRK